MTENLKYIKNNCYAVMFRLNVIVLVECLRGALSLDFSLLAGSACETTQYFFSFNSKDEPGI